MKRLLALILAILFVAGSFAACGKKEGTTASDRSSGAYDENSSSERPSEVFPLTLKDANNFEMTIAKRPEKIVSLTLGTDEMLLALVDKSRILSLTKFSDDPGISNVVEAAKDIKLRTESNAENVISIGPDLVFVDTWAKVEFVKQLRDSGILVYQFKTPSSVDEQRNTILEIAKVVGETEKGNELVAWMDKKMKDVADRVNTLKQDQKLTILSYDELGCTSGKGTNFDSIAEKAGLVNAAALAGMELWPALSKEKMVELNPDLMLLPSWFYDTSKTVNSFTDSIKKDPALASVKAVKNNRLLVLSNPHMSAISQYVVLGVEDMAKAAYPELFK